MQALLSVEVICRLDQEPSKKPPNLMRETKEENWEKMRTFLPRRKVDQCQRIMSLVKNLPTQLWETEEENWIWESINKKPPELDEEIWEKNWKIIDIVNRKNLPTWTKEREGKTEVYGKRRDLVGIRCYSVLSGIELQIVLSTKMQAPRCSLCREDRSPAFCRLLTLLETKLTRIPPYLLTWHAL